MNKLGDFLRAERGQARACRWANWPGWLGIATSTKACARRLTRLGTDRHGQGGPHGEASLRR